MNIDQILIDANYLPYERFQPPYMASDNRALSISDARILVPKAIRKGSGVYYARTIHQHCYPVLPFRTDVN